MPELSLLMTADTVGGVWTYALELCAALAPHRVRVDLCTMGPMPTDAQRADARSVSNVTLHESHFKLEWMPEPWDDVAHAGVWLQGVARQVRPDLVHHNGYAHAALDFGVPALAVGHSCVLSWWEAVKAEPAPASDWGRYREVVTRGLRRADAVVAPSEAMLAALQKHYGPLHDTAVIPNARARVALRPAGGGKKPFILAAGRLWDEAKNVSALCDVAAQLPWPVRVAGAGGEDFPNVTHLGLLAPEELAAQMAQAAIFCAPARYEPFGLAALEAAHSGCALVLGDIPSLREVWGDAALFVPPEDREGLARTLRSLVEDERLRAQLSQRARTRAAQFGGDRMARDYLTLYERLLAAPRRAAEGMSAR